jgi:hypothetical protein
VTEADLVQVQEQDLVLRQVLLDHPRQQHLLHLPLERLLAAQVEGPHHLLREGRPPLRVVSLPHVDHEGTHHAEPVETGVRAEPRVLRRDHRLDHDPGDVLERHHGAPSLLGEELADHRAFVARVHAAHLRRAVLLPQVLDRRESVRVLVQDDQDGDEAGQEEDQEGRAAPQEDPAEEPPPRPRGPVRLGPLPSPGPRGPLLSSSRRRLAVEAGAAPAPLCRRPLRRPVSPVGGLRCGHRRSIRIPPPRSQGSGREDGEIGDLRRGTRVPDRRRAGANGVLPRRSYARESRNSARGMVHRIPPVVATDARGSGP